MDDGRLKWEETDWCYLLAMLHKVLDQHTAQHLYPFILSSLPSLDTVSLYATKLPSLFFLFPAVYSEHSFQLLALQGLPVSFQSDRFCFLLPSSLVSSSLFPFVIVRACCGCLALDEAGVTLRVRNLTTQIT